MQIQIFSYRYTKLSWEVRTSWSMGQTRSHLDIAVMKKTNRTNKKKAFNFVKILNSV